MSRKSLEEEVKLLQKHLGGVVKMLKSLKGTVEVLEKKVDEKETKEIKDIIEAQAAIDAILVANSDAIKRIDKEIKSIVCDKTKVTVNKDTEDNVVSEDNDKKIQRKCKFYNAGYCKYKHKRCRFLHPENICKAYLKDLNCETKNCVDRHPRMCKWLRSKYGCRRGEECEYLHVTLADDDRVQSAHKMESEIGEYSCVGCKSIFSEERCVIKHTVQNMDTYFCLNCEEWIKDKARVFDQDWTLLDQHGYL